MLCLLLFLVSFFYSSESVEKKPHIIFILADDLGWNDVGFHGSNKISTGNIDALAYAGILLHNYYVTPICTPSRASLMTGKYAIHTGMQHSVLFGAEPRGLPLSEKILPQYLKEIGYKTHLVGKWHLGSYKKEYLPLNRGFDSHTGFWTGKIDMYDHTTMEQGSWGHDFRRGFNIAYDLFGQYATDVYTNEAIKVIDTHNKSEPLFLMVAHSAVHSGNPYEPLRAPDQLINNFSYIENYQRRKFAAMLTKLDESVGRVVSALQARDLLADSIIVFSSDNGGPAEGFNDNAASNYPLRGVKNTLWEGGVRGAGLVWGAGAARGRVARQPLHLVDWLPTLLAAAGYNVSAIENLDGIDQWETLSRNLESKRQSIVHNIDDIYGSAAITVGEWKLHQGTNYNGSWDYYYGPSGREGDYDIDKVMSSLAANALRHLDMLPSVSTMLELRKAATVSCNLSITPIPCYPLREPCLFNIEEDPCEQRNLASLKPEILQRMLSELQAVNSTVVPPNNRPLDPCGDPKYWGRVFTHFGDYENNATPAHCASETN